mmetsp:Transcript_4620/g.12626  ORF Transcript_4620/g.12626 Transcript_4620/m.12626 type:complete len:267 (-) Transcript_4620:756-1556(-)
MDLVYTGRKKNTSTEKMYTSQRQPPEGDRTSIESKVPQKEDQAPWRVSRTPRAVQVAQAGTLTGHKPLKGTDHSTQVCAVAAGRPGHTCCAQGAGGQTAARRACTAQAAVHKAWHASCTCVQASHTSPTPHLKRQATLQNMHSLMSDKGLNSFMYISATRGCGLLLPPFMLHILSTCYLLPILLFLQILPMLLLMPGRLFLPTYRLYPLPSTLLLPTWVFFRPIAVFVEALLLLLHFSAACAPRCQGVQLLLKQVDLLLQVHVPLL